MKANVNPRWKPFAIPAKKICANDLARPVLLEVLDWERSGAHRPIGYATTTVDALTSGGRATIQLRHPQGKGKDARRPNFSLRSSAKTALMARFL